jgi:F0F1-type ATP synthase membrane subunit a
LRVRLTANITAGHLLLILASSILSFLPSFISQMSLFCLELVVSLVQAFVFTLLMVIYIRERN